MLGDSCLKFDSELLVVQQVWFLQLPAATSLRVRVARPQPLFDLETVSRPFSPSDDSEIPMKDFLDDSKEVSELFPKETDPCPVLIVDCKVEVDEQTLV